METTSGYMVTVATAITDRFAAEYCMTNGRQVTDTKIMRTLSFNLTTKLLGPLINIFIRHGGHLQYTVKPKLTSVSEHICFDTPVTARSHREKCTDSAMPWEMCQNKTTNSNQLFLAMFPVS